MAFKVLVTFGFHWCDFHLFEGRAERGQHQLAALLHQNLKFHQYGLCCEGQACMDIVSFTFKPWNGEDVKKRHKKATGVLTTQYHWKCEVLRLNFEIVFSEQLWSKRTHFLWRAELGLLHTYIPWGDSEVLSRQSLLATTSRSAQPTNQYGTHD